LMVGSTLAKIAAKDLDRTGVGSDPSADAPDQRCLASPVGPQKPDNFSRANGKGNVVYSQLTAIAFAQIPDFYTHR